MEDILEIPPSPPGLETLVLLAREDSPLPCEDEARLAQGLSGPPISMPPESNKAVWIEDGEEVTFEPTAGPRKDRPATRVLSAASPTPRPARATIPCCGSAPVRDKVQPLGGYSQAVVFPNEGARQPLEDASP